jgi:sugar phosphate isomerase/epimerase
MGGLMPTSLKNKFPFRLGTTSFIHPADYSDNVRLLAPLVDEIELLFLESEHLPSGAQINELKILADTLDVAYNIHLPMDISLADPVSGIRQRSREAVLRTLERVVPLNASTHTLHVTFEMPDKLPVSVETWQTLAMENLDRLLAEAAAAAGDLTVETLDFPPQWLAPIVSELHLPVCVDVGHIVRFGFDLPSTLDLFAGKIGMFHLHGVTGDQDHRALDHLAEEARNLVASLLKNYHGSVSLEVFSLNDFTDSITCFSKMMALA